MKTYRYYIDKESYFCGGLVSYEIPPTYYNTLEEAKAEFDSIICDGDGIYLLCQEDEDGFGLCLEIKSNSQELLDKLSRAL